MEENEKRDIPAAHELSELWLPPHGMHNVETENYDRKINKTFC